MIDLHHAQPFSALAVHKGKYSALSLLCMCVWVCGCVCGGGLGTAAHLVTLLLVSIRYNVLVRQCTSTIAKIVHS